MAGSVTIQGNLTGLPLGQLNIGPFTLSGNSGNNLQSSATTFASVPTWAAGVIIIPNPSNAVGLTLKGVTGDTGIALSLTSPSLLEFPATPPASFGITAASNFTTITEIVFY